MRRQFAMSVRSAVAKVLVLWLAFGPGLAVSALAQEGGGAIHGFLYLEDGVRKIGGGKVIAIDISTGKHYESNTTGENGAYEITDLPAGTYDVVMQAMGVYIVETLVDLAEGQHLTLSLSRQPGTPPERRIAGMETPEGRAVPTTALPAVTAPTAGPSSFWKSTPGIVLLSVLGAGAALAIVNAVNDDDRDASPSSP